MASKVKNLHDLIVKDSKESGYSLDKMKDFYHLQELAIYQDQWEKLRTRDINHNRNSDTGGL